MVGVGPGERGRCYIGLGEVVANVIRGGKLKKRTGGQYVEERGRNQKCPRWGGRRGDQEDCDMPRFLEIPKKTKLCGEAADGFPGNRV